MTDEYGEHDEPQGLQERTFAALPPERGRGFARTWWGQTWLKALEDTALDSDQLKQGRKFARSGAVGAVSVRPGRITAVVRDRDHTAHRSDVVLQQLDAQAWDRLLDMIADEAGHIAALLDRELPPNLGEDAAAAGVELMPGIGDLEPECSCGAWDHCPHTAALCYQLARLLDQDPFILLLMRGRGERELLDDLQLRTVAHAEAEHSAVRQAEGVLAAEVYALGAVLPPLPAPPPTVEAPGAALRLTGGTPPDPGVDTAALEFLAACTAARARRLLAEALAPGHSESRPPEPLTEWEDGVRLAAGHPPADVATRIAEGFGRTTRELEQAVAAWESGGRAALDELFQPVQAASSRARR